MTLEDELGRTLTKGMLALLQMQVPRKSVEDEHTSNACSVDGFMDVDDDPICYTP
ncbi:hypothetical protein HAX54_017367, partial [Datura stramonium]|nr:hypothetical protein [Datura stramonium]